MGLLHAPRVDLKIKMQVRGDKEKNRRQSTRMCKRHKVTLIVFSILAFFPIPTSIAQANYVSKPADDDGPQYVSAVGNDANDGLSEKSAKLTVMAAYAALPARGGTIYIYDGSPCNSVRGAGIWIMGSDDPNYSSPPSGWTQAKGGTTFVGIPTSSSGPNGHMGRANLVSCGSSADINHPGIWISGVNSNVLFFQNLNINGAGRSIVIGEDSKHSRSGDGGSSGLSFWNVSGNPGGTAGLGPPLDIVGGSFWIYIMHCGFSGLDALNTPTANNAAAILLDGTGNDGIGYIFIDHVNLAGGGIKLNPGTVNPSIQTVDITGVDTENIHAPAAVWFTGQFNSVLVQGVHVNDPIGTLCNGSVCAIENDGSGPAENIHVADVYSSASPMVKGPMLILSQVGQPAGGAPYLSGQVGFQNGYVYGNTDASRRGFSPTAVRFANQANSSPSSWALNTGTVTTGITAPDGTTGAGRLGNRSSRGVTYFYPQKNVIVAVGDVLMAGVWERLNSGTAWPSPGGIGITGCSVKLKTPGYSSTTSLPAGPTDGEWHWSSVIAKISAVSHNPCTLGFAGQSLANGTADFYAPFYARIPAGTYADNEVMMIYYNLESFGSSCAVGTICGLPGQQLIEAQYGTLSNCRSSASPAVCGSAAAGSVVVGARSGSVLVDTTAVTANSQVFVTFDSSLGAKLGVTCNTTYDAPYVSARRPGEGFTISVASRPSANPACYSYSVIN